MQSYSNLEFWLFRKINIETNINMNIKYISVQNI